MKKLRPPEEKTHYFDHEFLKKADAGNVFSKGFLNVTFNGAFK